MLFYHLQVKSLCASLLDSNVLVQRNNLEIVLFFFPFYTCLVSRLCSPRKSLVFPRMWGAGGRWDRSRQLYSSHFAVTICFQLAEASLFIFVRMVFP